MKVHLLSTSPYSANVYLLPDAGVLIDTGISGSDTLAAVSRFMPPEDLEMVVLTHAHYDHSGALVDIVKRSGAGIALHRDDAPLLCDNQGSVAVMFGAVAPDVGVDRLLLDGDVIAGVGLEVIHTPGHTPGSICLYQRESKVLFSGDTVFGGGGVGRVDLFGGDAAALVRSIERLTKLDIEVLYPGHGEPFSDNVAEDLELSLVLAKSLL
jgi:glyoxylase-like metal-dependent hydrolase (beta-lactamase superfamily II)